MSSITEQIEADKQLARSLQGTYLFDGVRAQKNYPLNKMCMSLTKTENRDAFKANEEAYCRKYGLDEESIRLVMSRNWIGMIRAGGNIYYVFKLAAIDHVSMQHVGAQGRKPQEKRCSMTPPVRCVLRVVHAVIVRPLRTAAQRRELAQLSDRQLRDAGIDPALAGRGKAVAVDRSILLRLLPLSHS